MKQKQKQDTICTKQNTLSTEVNNTNVYYNESNHQELCNEFKILLSDSDVDLYTTALQPFKNLVDFSLVRPNTDYLTHSYADLTLKHRSRNTSHLFWYQHPMHQECIEQVLK